MAEPGLALNVRIRRAPWMANAANVVLGTTGDSLLLTLGVGILAEGLVVLYRTLRGGRPVPWGQTRRDP